MQFLIYMPYNQLIGYILQKIARNSKYQKLAILLPTVSALLRDAAKVGNVLV